MIQFIIAVMAMGKNVKLKQGDGIEVCLNKAEPS